MRILLLLTILTGALVAAQLAAQDEAVAPDAEPIIIETDDDSGSADEEQDTGAADARAEDEDERFIPSTEVPPDEQVIFPIDI